MTVLRSGSATDVGRVRSVNEDMAFEGPALFAVADGMGGHAGGEVAARLAIETVAGGFNRNPTSDGVVEAVESANRVVWERSRSDPDVRGMGTTITVAALVGTEGGDRLVLANVGDSRAYRLRGEELVQLTTDHSVAEELVARGELSEAEAAVHPHRHILTRALGVSPEIDVDAWLLDPVEGDRYLLCSDGLSNEVAPDRIKEVLSRRVDAEQAAHELVEMANTHGGSDNITAVVIDVVVGEPPTGDGSVGGRTALASGAAAGVVPLTSSAVPASASAPDVPVDDSVTGVVPAVPDEAAPSTISAGEDRRRRGRGPRILTVRLVVFLILLAAVAYGAYAAVQWYWTNSYYVKSAPVKGAGGQVQPEIFIYQGRQGGFLWLNPKKVKGWTPVPLSNVPQDVVGAIKQGEEQSSLSAAESYVERNECLMQRNLPFCSKLGLGTTTSVAAGVVTGPGGTT